MPNDTNHRSAYITEEAWQRFKKNAGLLEQSASERLQLLVDSDNATFELMNFVAATTTSEQRAATKQFARLCKQNGWDPGQRLFELVFNDVQYMLRKEGNAKTTTTKANTKSTDKPARGRDKAKRT